MKTKAKAAEKSKPTGVVTLHANGSTPLMRAAAIKKDNPVELVALLNDPAHRATIFDRDARGKTALDWARIANNYLGVRLLLDAINTEIHNARIDSIAPPEQLHRFLLSTNTYQGSQLLKAIQERHPEVAEELLHNNRLSRQEIEALGQRFFTDTKNRVGYTPLMLAAGMNMKDIVRELIALKVPVNDQNQFGQTALTIACSTGNADVVQYLLASGADVQHRTGEGRTVLHYACMYAKAKLVKIILNFLIERFAVFRIEGHKLVDFDYTRWTTYSAIITNFLNARDNDGKTALELLPKKLDNKYRIEKRLKLSGVTGLDRISRKAVDKWSVGSESGRLQNMDDLESQGDELDEELQPYVHKAPLRNDPHHLSATAAGAQGLPVSKAGVTGAGGGGGGGVDSPMAASHRFQIPPRHQYGDEDDVVDPDVDSVVSEVTESTQFSFFDFSHNTDNDIVPSTVEDAYSAYTSMPFEKELEYIRNCFDAVSLKVMQWQSNAEKEKELAQVLPCPLECGAMCKVEDMTSHVRDECPLRTLQCPTCYMIILQKDVQVHATRLCGKRTIACPNAYTGCPVLITPDSKDLHLRTKCEYRQVPCRQFCSAVIVWKDLDKHEAEFCKNRQIECDRCRQSMTACAYPSHLLDACPERLLTCRIGCGRQFKAKDLEAHEEQECQGYCKWQCGTRLGPPAKLALHENVQCLDRPMTCCLGCNVPRLTLRNKAHHEQLQCSLRMVPCTFGCGEVLPMRHLRRHQQMFMGTCTRRLVYCPSNLVGWRIKLVQRNVDALVLKYERKKLPSEAARRASQNSAAGFIAESEQTMAYRTEIVFGDFLYVRSPKGQLWVNVWTTDFMLLEKAVGDQVDKSLHRDCHFTCGKFLFTELTNHLYLSCPNRKVAITGEVDRAKNAVGQVVPLAEAVGTTKLRLDYDDFEEREKVNDDGSQGIYNVTCSYCAKTVLRSEYEAHCIKDCSEYHIFCPFGCGKYMPNRDVEPHCRDDCPKRSVTCLACQFTDLWAEELEKHQREKCPKRLVSCTFDCGIDTLCACDKTTHEEEECPLRSVMCSCGLLFQAKDLDDHARLNCVNRQVYCPQGCGESMKQCEVDDHIEFFCRNKTHYFNQTIECGNGCGCVLMRRDLLNHVSFECTKRLVECSQNCGNTVALDNLKSHLRVCPQRIICCEPGMTMCAKPFHEWFYKMPPEDDDDSTYHNIALAHLKKPSASSSKTLKTTGTINQLTLLGASHMTSMSSFQDTVQRLHAMGADEEDHGSQASFSEESFKRKRKEAFTEAHAKLRGAFKSKYASDKPTMNATTVNRLSRVDEDAATDREEDAGGGGPADAAEAVVTHDDDGSVAGDDDDDDENNVFRQTFGKKQERLFRGNAVNISLNVGDKFPGAASVTGAGSSQGNGTTGTAAKSIFDMLVVSRNKAKAKATDISYSGSSIGGHSSIYYDGPAMKFREDIRMHFCTRHRVHALMTAIRYQEYDVLEFIARQVKQSADIDVENVSGDTALTLACRMGNLPFVEILITHGADINKETFNGRTPLIEAVKCDTENVPLIEYLIREGALIKYKTARHGKTALDWARRYAYQEAQELKEKAAISGEYIEITKERMRVLGRPRTVRLLELAAIVQQQSNMMFQKIAVGDSAWVLRVIQEGDFFDPNNEVKAYAEMEKFAVKAEDADRALAEVQMKTFGLSHSVDQLGAQRQQVLAEIAKAEVVVRQAHEKERSLDSTINGEFTAYEKVAAQMKLVDLEEMVRLQKPTEILLATMYATGILFDLFDDRAQFQLDQLLKSKPWPTQQLASQLQLPSSSTLSSVAIAEDPTASMPTLSLAFILEAKPIWFPIVSTFLRANMREALRRLQTYSRAKIHLDLSQPLFAKVMEMIQVFKMLAYQASAQAAATATGGTTKKPFSLSSSAQRSAEKAASKAARAERRRQRRQSQTASGDGSLPASPPPASPPTRSSQRSPSPNGGARKRISFTPDVTLQMPLLGGGGGDDAEFTAAMLAAAQETTSAVSPWQQTSTAANDAGWALTTATMTSNTSAATGDAFWSGIDPDILGVPYVDAVQAEEEAKDRQRREAYKAWLDYQLVAAGKKKKDATQTMVTTKGTSSLAASLTGSLNGLGNSLRGSSLSPPRVTTTIADGKPVIIRPSTALSMFDDDDRRGGDDQTDTDAMPNEIDDADWDSDAEGANTGKWEKGEWVPNVKPKKTWWDPTALAQQLAAEKEEKAKKRVVEEQQQWKNAKIIRITDNWLHEETKRTVEDLEKTQKMPEDYEQALLASIRQKQLEAEEAAAAEAEAKRANSRSRSLRNSVMLEDGTIRKSRSKSGAAKSGSQVFSASDFLNAPSGLDALPNTPFVAGDELGGEGVGGDGDDGEGSSPDGRMRSPPADGSPSSALRARRQSRRASSSRRKSRSAFDLPTLPDDDDAASHYSGGSGASSRSGSPSSRRKRRAHRRKSTMVGDELLDYDLLGQVSPDDFVGYTYVASIDRLVRAITRFALNYKDVLIYKQGTLHAIRHLEDLKVQAAELLTQYEERYAYRATVERDYIQAMKTAKFYHDKVSAFKEKVRVARLMNNVSVNGHTPISWAAAYGAYDIVEEMLSRGGMVGYNAQLYHMTATYLQMSYQIYQVSYRARNRQADEAKVRRDKAQGLLPKDLPLVAGSSGNSKAQQMELMKELTMLRDKRQKLLDHIKYLRSKMRFPVPEAVYCGKWELVKRIFDRRLLQPYFMNTWTYPSPPPTYRRRLERQYDHEKMSILEVLTHGMNDLAAGWYMPEFGWVGANDPREPYGETYMEIHRIVQLLKERKYAFLQGRHRIRILANERRNQREGEKAMIAAILRHDFVMCMQLAQDRGITIDLETSDGQTALIAASEEDPDAMNHEYMVNLDGRKCLAVEFLLDRVYYRPGVNLETTKGYTALIRAAMLGRAHVVSALLDRGANIDYQNTLHGRTALHYAAACGHETVTRILVERLANVTLRDHNGQTPYDIAEQENFIQLMSVLSQFRSGNLGTVQLTRGYVNNQKLCPLGCGTILLPFDVPAHVNECPLRIVPCPLGCELRTLAREIDDHLQAECPKRFITCPECHQPDQFRAEELPIHLHDDCIKRIVACPLECGKEMEFHDVALHVERLCAHRLVPCPNQCPMDMQLRFIDLPEHLETTCINRRVPCPLKCRSMVIFHRLAEHMDQVCSLRPTTCQFCHTTVTFEAKDRHEAQECAQRLVPCPWKCGQSVSVGELEEHKATVCGKQAVECSLGCGRKVYRAVMETHQRTECTNRLVPCPHGCMETIAASSTTTATTASVAPGAPPQERPRCVPAKLLPYHLKYDCPHRPARCSLCQGDVTAATLTHHQEDQCPRRMVHCRNPGCQKTLPFDEREEHEIRLCRFRMAPCPQGCGERVLTLHMTNHCARQCPMRYVDACPYQCTLTQPLRAKDVDYHLACECPRRHQQPAAAVMSSTQPLAKPPGSANRSTQSRQGTAAPSLSSADGDGLNVAASAAMHQLLAATAPPMRSSSQLASTTPSLSSVASSPHLLMSSSMSALSMRKMTQPSAALSSTSPSPSPSPLQSRTRPSSTQQPLPR